MAHAQRGTVIGLGELLWDVFNGERRAGGAPANVAFHTSQLGFDGIVCSRVGDDPLGDELVSLLGSRGLDTRHLQRDPDHPTSTVSVDTSIAHEPRYTIHENVAWDYLEFDQALEESMCSARAVCFGTLAQRSPTSRATIHRCLDSASAAKRIYDVNLRPPHYHRAWIEHSLLDAHVVKMSESEIELLAEMLDISAADSTDAASAFVARFDLELVCITRGERGAVLVSPDEHIDQPGVSIELVDPVGAGDAFTAALATGLLRHWPLARCADLANRYAALVASRPGATPVLLDEAEQLLDECG
jgi:fructokinase